MDSLLWDEKSVDSKVFWNYQSDVLRRRGQTTSRTLYYLHSQECETSRSRLGRKVRAISEVSLDEENPKRIVEVGDASNHLKDQQVSKRTWVI